MLSKSSSNPKARIIYTTGINQFISHWQRCIDCNSSYILINKGVFEPSYNDLKFTVQNCSYFGTNLIISNVQRKCVCLKEYKFYAVKC